MRTGKFAFLLLAALAMGVPALCGDVQRPSAVPTPNLKPGGILCEFFKGIPGGSVNDLVKNPAFPNTPAESLLLSTFEIPTDTDDNYGTVVRGFITPPTTGNYTFWIASDDGSELWLSPSENPKEKIKLCQCGYSPARAWDTNAEQKSKPIPLQANRKYYIEALHKEGAGGDHLAVGWQLPDNTFERPIPGKRLIPAGAAKPQPPVAVKIEGQLPSTPGFHKCKSKVSGIGEPFDFPFLLYIPKIFGQEPVPSLLFLHGVGECGTDLEGVYWNGPSGHIKNDAKLREFMPFMVISPQCQPGWNWSQRRIIKATVGLMDELLKGYGRYVDKDRVTMTGLSMGGVGTWHIALEAPEKFAAIVPSDPRAARPEEAAEKLKDIAVWIIAGAVDGDFTKGAQEMFEALKNSIPKPTLMLVPNCGHGAWGYYYPKRQFYEWLLKWKRGVNVALAQPAAKQPPAKPPEKPAEKPKEVAVTPPPKEIKPPDKSPEPKPPAKVAETPKPPEPPAKVTETPKPPEPPAKVAEAPKPPETPAKVAEAPKPPEPKIAEAPKPPEPKAIEAPNPPASVAKVTEAPKPIEPPKPEAAKPLSPPGIVIAKPPTLDKLPEPVKPVAAVTPNIPTPPVVTAPAKSEEPAASPTRAARSSGFPYAQTSLFFATLFMFISLYCLLTNADATEPKQRPRRVISHR